MFLQTSVKRSLELRCDNIEYVLMKVVFPVKDDHPISFILDCFK